MALRRIFLNSERNMNVKFLDSTFAIEVLKNIIFSTENMFFPFLFLFYDSFS